MVSNERMANLEAVASQATGCIIQIFSVLWRLAPTDDSEKSEKIRQEISVLSSRIDTLLEKLETAITHASK